MKPFDNIKGKRIVKIQRIDSQADYEFYSPYALVLTLEQLNEKLILTATNDGTSTDIRLSNDHDIEGDFGLEFNESILNDLKPDDELNQFEYQKIKELRVAEFNEPELQGNGFIIKQRNIAGIELKAEKNKLLFWNNHGGWVDIDDDVDELPNPDRWNWK
ncbi:hypothetical protein [Halocola ammonii]